MKQWVVGDFETASSCDLKKSGAARYSEDPGTEILCFAYSVMGKEPVVWLPNRSDMKLLLPNPIEEELRSLAADPDTVFIAHNTGFEKAIWRNIMMPDFGFPDIPNNRWHDTMAVAAHKAFPQELDTLCRVLCLGQEKDQD